MNRTLASEDAILNDDNGVEVRQSSLGVLRPLTSIVQIESIYHEVPFVTTETHRSQRSGGARLIDYPLLFPQGS